MTNIKAIIRYTLKFTFQIGSRVFFKTEAKIHHFYFFNVKLREKILY